MPLFLVTHGDLFLKPHHIYIHFLLQSKLQRITRFQFKGILSEAYCDWCHSIGSSAHYQLIRFYKDIDPMLAIKNVELYFLQLIWQVRIELQLVLASFNARVASLDEVDCARHGAEMNTLRRSTTLDI